MNERERELFNTKILNEYKELYTELSVAAVLLDYEKQLAPAIEILKAETSFTFISNIKNLNYYFLHPSLAHLTGYSIEQIQQLGLSFLSSIIYKDDLPAVNKILKLWYSAVVALPMEERIKAEVAIHFRLMDANEKTTWVIVYLQLLAIDTNGVPIIEKGTIKINSILKTDSIVAGTITINGVQTILHHLPYLPKPHLYTDKEMEVMMYLHQSFSNKEIADKMGNEENTVKKHRRNIVKKYCEFHFPEITGKTIDIFIIIDELHNKGLL